MTATAEKTNSSIGISKMAPMPSGFFRFDRQNYFLTISVASFCPTSLSLEALNRFKGFIVTFTSEEYKENAQKAISEIPNGGANNKKTKL